MFGFCLHLYPIMTIEDKLDYIKENRYWGLNSDLMNSGFKRNSVVIALRLEPPTTKKQQAIVSKAYELCVNYKNNVH